MGKLAGMLLTLYDNTGPTVELPDVTILPCNRKDMGWRLSVSLSLSRAFEGQLLFCSSDKLFYLLHRFVYVQYIFMDEVTARAKSRTHAGCDRKYNEEWTHWFMFT